MAGYWQIYLYDGGTIGLTSTPNLSTWVIIGNDSYLVGVE
jgi:hypothetical protein